MLNCLNFEVVLSDKKMYNSTSIANLPLTTLCHLLPKIYLLNNMYGDKVLFILYYFFFFYLSVFPFSQKINIYWAREYNLLEH